MQSGYPAEAERVGDTRWLFRLGVPGRDGESELQGMEDLPRDLPGARSEEKAHVFVAMPFGEDMEDVFHFGIQQPAREAGLVCERVDQEVFTGDIMDRVKERIGSAALVVADLTGANPNVYLEVGYAWGQGQPTVLLARAEEELLFDVRGQRCLKYRTIKQLREALVRELQTLRTST